MIQRRAFFIQCAASAVATAATGRLAAQTLRHDPFLLGVASGSPSVDGMVLWTRLMVSPVGEPLPAVPIEVRWELASDSQFKRIVKTGKEFALPDFAHSVHVEISGVVSVTDSSKPVFYWYRFMVGDAISPVGRTRTLPRPESRTPLKLALASCQNYEHGYFTSYRHMAQEDLDVVVFVGDYIYEYGITPNRTRQHNSPTALSLDDYRARYALYKSDVDLQAAHAAFPWIVTWDDHELENDYANDRSASDRGEHFMRKRAAAYRAYWEHMPLRKTQLPEGDQAQMYRRYAWGQTANLHMLDARQYRDYQVCTPADQGGSRTITDQNCPERLSRSSSLLGSQQEAWLADGIVRSDASFNIVGQASIMAQMRMPANRAPETTTADGFWNDSWDGYPLARQRTLEQWAQKKNVISLGGDVHATYINHLVSNFDDPKSPILATEIVGTSISSPSWPQAATERIMGFNPHMQFGKSDLRGYTVLRVDGNLATVMPRVIDNARVRESTLSTAAQFVIESARPGVQRV